MIAPRRRFRLPGELYPIVDLGVRGRWPPLELAEILLRSGARLLQLRAKQASTREVVDLARLLRERATAHGALLMVNDRADVARLVAAAGVHLGQDDLSPEDARNLLGPDAIIGLSTHDPDQVSDADGRPAVDYIGFGPIFPTAHKDNPDPCQGLAGLAAIRPRTRLPIVAIGGITSETARDVLAAGADAVAMIGALATAADPAEIVRALA